MDYKEQLFQVIKSFTKTNDNQLFYSEDPSVRTIVHSVLFNYNLIFNSKIEHVSGGSPCRHTDCGYCIGFSMLMYLAELNEIEVQKNLSETTGCVFFHTLEDFDVINEKVYNAMNELNEEDEIPNNLIELIEWKTNFLHSDAKYHSSTNYIIRSNIVPKLNDNIFVKEESSEDESSEDESSEDESSEEKPEPEEAKPEYTYRAMLQKKNQNRNVIDFDF